MQIYVTGAGGFVGGRLLPKLEAGGHTTIATDLEVDITDPSAIRAAVADARPDAVIHLAALSSVAQSMSASERTYQINYVGSFNLLRAVHSEAPEARVLMIGSGDQYVPTRPEDPPRKESDALFPRSPYAKTKAAAEQLASQAMREGLDVVRVRAFNHTGAGQGTQFVASDFAKQIAEIAAGQRVPEMHVGNLDSVRDFLNVEDVLDAYVALLERDVPAEIYNVASGVGTSIRDLLDTLCELAGVTPKVETDPARFRPTDAMVGDSTRLREATGWSPRIALRDTLAELLAYWQGELGEQGTQSK
jgi:GDP-4-dehydro-6-deoxy-D-mannose reductase